MSAHPVFELDHINAKLCSYTPRRELHGDDPKPAASLAFEVKLGADLLCMFAPTLRQSFFHKSPAAARNLADAAADANDLRYPQIEDPLRWTLEMIGCEITIHRGIGPKSDLLLPLCNVDNFTILPQQGGIVTIRFRVACHPDEKQSGRLAMMIGEDCEISLDPPKAEVDLAGERPPRTGGRRKAADEAMAGA